MVTLTFDINKEKAAADGYTVDELLQPMRDHAKKYGADEPEYGVFAMDGEDAMCVLGMFVTDITRQNHKYVTYFDSWLFDVDGEVEDCIEATLRWRKKEDNKEN